MLFLALLLAEDFAVEFLAAEFFALEALLVLFLAVLFFALLFFALRFSMIFNLLSAEGPFAPYADILSRVFAGYAERMK